MIAPATTPTTVTLTVLSVHQPFASAFFSPDPAKRKWCENRTWDTPYRGPLWIHASKMERRPSREKLAECSEGIAVDSILSLWDPQPGETLPVGAIIGCVELWEVADRDTLELLGMVKQGATELPKDVAACLRPTERNGWLDRWREVHESLAEIGEVPFYTHLDGPLCWLVRNPRRLVEPILTGGKLNLWKFEATSEQLEMPA